MIKKIREIEDIKVTFTDNEHNIVNSEIKKFVDALSPKNQSHDHYKDERNAVPGKVVKDNFLGKKAEFFVAKYFCERGFPYIRPDMEIREGGAKGWDFDLPYKQIDARLPNVHVKACNRGTINIAGNCSWTIQFANKNGVGGKDSIFDGPGDDLVVFVFMETAESNTCTIRAILPWKDVEPCLEEPRKRSLRPFKRCFSYGTTTEILKHIYKTEKVNSNYVRLY